MTKRSRHERERRAVEDERVRQVEDAWRRSLTPEVAEAFERDVEVARNRGPEAPRPNMAPGTPPRPPRPGREPKPPKENGRRGGRR